MKLIRIDDPTQYALIHAQYHAGAINFLVLQRENGERFQAFIKACHPELRGFSVEVN